MSESRVRPLLRWAGSKRQLLPTLSQYWRPEYKRYVEPFAGSAGLFFHLQPPAAVLGDINADLIAMYQEVRDNVDEVIREIAQLKKGREDYLRLRAVSQESQSSAERAARFLYLNRYCFNGLYRTNRLGHFNVPYGGDKSGELHSADWLRGSSELLKRVELVPGDFRNVLCRVRPGDLVYMDPPYRIAARRIFNEYDRSVFASDDLKRLRASMEKLAAQDIAFIVSYAECEEADALREGFYTRVVTVRRNIAGFTGSRRATNEVLISNERPG